MYHWAVAKAPSGSIGDLVLLVAGVLLGTAVLDALLTPTAPCPICGKPVRQNVSPCPNPSCQTVLYWPKPPK